MTDLLEALDEIANARRMHDPCGASEDPMAFALRLQRIARRALPSPRSTPISDNRPEPSPQPELLAVVHRESTGREIVVVALPHTESHSRGEASPPHTDK